MFSDIVADVASLIFPRTCPVCGEPLPRRGGVVCPMCEITAPLTNLWLERGNAMMQRFWGQLPVEQASAFFWYVNESDWRKMVHNFKYYGAWRTAYNLGRWYGACMKQGGLYDTVDVAVPVPLHLRRTLARGYNQSEMLAAGIARELGIKVERGCLRRVQYNQSQTRYSTVGRWGNVEGIFTVRHADRLAGRHAAGGRCLHHGRHDHLVRQRDHGGDRGCASERCDAGRAAQTTGREAVTAASGGSRGAKYGKRPCRSAEIV
ncbi:MAG: ComF family protein [Bacteroidales bacterium]|nr:MAG: ComF family protein [Bacteroidales bacterium]